MIEDCADDPPRDQPEAFLRALHAATEAGGMTSFAVEATPTRFRERVRGPLLAPGDAGFDEATRLWNGMIEKTPALVVQPTGTADVVPAVELRSRARPRALGARAAATTSPAPRWPTAA